MAARAHYAGTALGIELRTKELAATYRRPAMRPFIHALTCCALLTAVGPASAQAAIIIDFEPPFASNPEWNILFNDPSLTLSGTTVEGITNSTPGTVFTFTGTEPLLGDGGQARVQSADGSFTSLLIEPEADDTWFAKFEANLSVLKPARGHASGMLTVTAYDKFGLPTVGTHTISSNGNNFFNVFASDSDLISAILIESAVSLTEARQIRVGGIATEPGESEQVPEPAALLLLGLGLMAAGRRMRKRPV